MQDWMRRNFYSRLGTAVEHMIVDMLDFKVVFGRPGKSH